MSKKKSLILNLHNDYRNKLAGGEMTDFNTATRMATMVWDNELAQLAALNVKQCVMKHDACRNTDKFRHSGQNLGVYSWYGSTKTTDWLITNRINAWWNEYPYCTKSHINSYPSSYSGP